MGMLTWVGALVGRAAQVRRVTQSFPSPLLAHCLGFAELPRESSSAAPTICIRRSEDALSRNHCAWLPLTATWHCVRRLEFSFPARISLQLRQAQLHCGNQNYSVAPAYELISHASEISSKSGRTHSMGMPPFFVVENSHS